MSKLCPKNVNIIWFIEDCGQYVVGNREQLHHEGHEKKSLLGNQDNNLCRATPPGYFDPTYSNIQDLWDWSLI